MKTFFRRLLQPINLLTLLLGLAAVIFAYLYQYDGLGIMAVNPGSKTDSFRVPHLLVGLLIMSLAIRLIIEYKAWLAGSYMLFLVAYGFLVSIIPNGFFAHLIQGKGIWDIIIVFFIVPILLMVFYIWRRISNEHQQD